MDDLRYLPCQQRVIGLFKENLNACRSSEHPTQGKNVVPANHVFHDARALFVHDCRLYIYICKLCMVITYSSSLIV